MDRADVIVTACAFIGFINHVMTSDSPAHHANRVLSKAVSFRRHNNGEDFCGPTVPPLTVSALLIAIVQQPGDQSDASLRK